MAHHFAHAPLTTAERAAGIQAIPGEPWVNTAEEIEQHELADLLAA